MAIGCQRWSESCRAAEAVGAERAFFFFYSVLSHLSEMGNGCELLV